MTALTAADIPPCTFSSTTEVAEACDQVMRRLGGAAMRADIAALAGCRKGAEDIRAAVGTGHLGHDARLAAEETLRRCERAIGVALRRGQENGTLRWYNRTEIGGMRLPSAEDYFTRGDLYGGGNGGKVGIYGLADAGDNDFEAAIAAGRKNGELSRAAIARVLAGDALELGVPDRDNRTFAAIGQRLEVIKAMAAAGHTSRQISDRIGRSVRHVRDIASREDIPIRGDQVTGKRRDHGSERIVDHTVSAMEGLAMSAGLVEFADLDPGQIEGWVTSLTRSIGALNQMKNTLSKMKEITQP